MAKNEVKADANGKFKIKAKEIPNMGNLDLELEFVKSGDKDKHIVEELTDEDITAKKPNQPSPPATWNNQTITWFVNFNIHQKKADNTQGDYATVEYYVSLTLPEGKSLLFYYGGQVHDKTKEFRDNKRVKLSAGDPPGGYVP